MPTYRHAWYLVDDPDGGTERTWHAWLSPTTLTREQEKVTPPMSALCGFGSQILGMPRNPAMGPYWRALSAFNVTFDPKTVCSDQLCPKCAAAASGLPFSTRSQDAFLASKSESVNHPSHYGGDTVYETIKVIDAWGLDFPIGNAVKYLSRAGKKDPAKEIEDLRKAIFYIEHKIKRLEGIR